MTVAPANALNSQVVDSVSGGAVTFTVENTSNTASSNANFAVSVAGASASDPLYRTFRAGTNTWAWGIGNSSSDAWILVSQPPVTFDIVMRAETTGETTRPFQPAFLAYLSTTQLNVSGDNASFTVVADVEVFDNGLDYSTVTGIFTAPITGRYQFHEVSLWTGGTSLRISTCQLISSNRAYSANLRSSTLGSVGSQGGHWRFLTDMDAGDTAEYRVSSNDSGGKIDDIVGNTTLGTYWSGHLVC